MPVAERSGARIDRARGNQLFDLFLAKKFLPSQHDSDQGDLGVMLDDLHFHVCPVEVLAVCDDSMVRHQDRIIVRHERHQGISELGGPRSAIGRKRDAPQAKHGFRE